MIKTFGGILMQFFGAVSVLCLSLYLSLCGTRVFRERLAQLDGLLLLLRHIRERIACFHTPKGEILESFQNPALARAGLLAALGGGDLAAALTATGDRLYLDESEAAILAEFAEGFGTGFAREELARCDLAISRLEGAIAARREATPRAAKLYRTVVMCTAMAIVIIFI